MYTSFPKETFSQVPNSKISIPLKTNKQVIPWNFTEEAEEFILYYLAKGPEQDIET